MTARKTQKMELSATAPTAAVSSAAPSLSSSSTATSPDRKVIRFCFFQSKGVVNFSI